MFVELFHVRNNLRESGSLPQYSDILVDELPEKLPPLHKVDHRILIKIDKPWTAPQYRLAEVEKRAR